MFDLYYTTFAIANWEAGIPRNAVHQHNSLSKASGAHSVAVAVPFVPPRQSGAHTVSLSTYLLFEPPHNTSLEPYAPLCNDSTKRTSNNDTAKSSHPVYTGAPIHFTFFSDLFGLSTHYFPPNATISQLDRPITTWMHQSTYPIYMGV